MTDRDKKLQRVIELSKVIELHGKQSLTREQAQDVQNAQYRMEFQLNELVKESKGKEADIKIKAMEEIIKIINNKT